MFSKMFSTRQNFTFIYNFDFITTINSLMHISFVFFARFMYLTCICIKSLFKLEYMKRKISNAIQVFCLFLKIKCGIISSKCTGCDSFQFCELNSMDKNPRTINIVASCRCTGYRWGREILLKIQVNITFMVTVRFSRCHSLIVIISCVFHLFDCFLNFIRL